MMLKGKPSSSLLFLVLISLIFATNIGAQTTAITYQGELNDGGVPAQGTHDFEFTLFDAVAGGNMIESTVTVLAQPVSDGIFTVQIDFGGVAFENGDRWLEIGVRQAGVGNYQTLSPRQPLSPTPFAITAYRVLNGAIENRSLANNSISTIKIQDGAITTDKIADDAVTGAKIADDTVGNRNMLDNAIDTLEIRAGAVTRPKIADGAVTGNQMADSIQVGSGASSGTIAAWNGNDMQTGVEMLGDSRRLLVYAPTGVPRASLDVPAGGRLLLNDSFDFPSIAIEAEQGIESTDTISLVVGIGDTDPLVEITETGDGGQVFTRTGAGDEKARLGADAFGAVLILRQDDGDTGVLARGDLGGRGWMQVSGPTGDSRVVIDSAEATGQSSISFFENNSLGTFITSSAASFINDRLGVNRNPLVNALEVGGNASKTSAGDWLANSDVRIKTDVRPIMGALDTLDKVKPVTFRYTPEYLEQHPSLENIDYYNVVAQDFEQVFPDAVMEGGDTLASGAPILQVDTHPAMITALAALQELHAMVRRQEARIERLEEKLRAANGGNAP